MNQIKTFALILLSAIGFAAFGQDDVAIGRWRTHLPFQQVVDVEVFGNKVYAATPFELFYYDQDDNSVNILNKINGLSDVGISTIRYNKKENLLFVGYTDANVDLIYANGEITNMSDIKDKVLLGNKTINNVTFDDNLAYVACGFGIVVFDLRRCEVKDTYYIGNQGSMINVKDVAFYNGRIYASTENGLYSASRDAQNLANFASWRFERDLIHPHLAYDELEAFSDKLYLNYNGGFNSDTVFVFDGSRWDYFKKSIPDVRQELRAYDDYFLVTSQYNVFVYDTQMQEVLNIFEPGSTKINPLSAAIDDKGCYWIGDSYRGMVKTTNSWNNDDIIPNGPYTKNVFQLQACGNQVWVATGGHGSNWSKRYMKEGVFRFDGSWTCFNRTLLPELDGYSDFVCTVTDPQDPSVTYVGTWGDGLLKLKDGRLVEVYNAENSTLDYWTADPSLILICGLAFDSKGNLWVANSGAPNLLSVMEPNGQWHSFNLGGSYSSIDIAALYIDTHDIKWIVRRVGQDTQVVVFNDNGTLDIASDDQVKGLNKSTGGLIGNAVNCIAVDKNKGIVWVGTDTGPCYFDDSRKLFTESNCQASRPQVDRNDGTHQFDYLFDGSNVLSMAVDGGGNKWFGLESGAYVVDDSQKVVLKHSFNTGNSPLLDNAVKSMAINADGEVFFGTDNGIISFKGEASDPDPVVTDVTAYPNPVRPDYNGYVGIKGLANESIVRITTVDGNFVKELISEGGQAVWDCTSADGRKVTPGVYLIFVSNDEGQNRFATKILVMN